MPRQGYKSISVKEEDFDYFQRLFEERRDELRKQGITTFAGFITKILYVAIELDERRTREEKARVP